MNLTLLLPMPYTYFVPSGYPKFTERAIRVLRSGEVGVVLFNPKMDRPLRISQLIQDYQKEYPLVKIDLASGHTNDLNYILPSVEQQLGRMSQKNLGICISNCELFISEQNYPVIEEIVQLRHTKPNYRFLLFFEVDITHPDIASKFSLNEVFNNIIYYPLYEYEDTMNFINYSLHEWEIQLDNSIKEQIIKACGGQFWLVREAVRAFRDDPETTIEQVFQSDSIRFRLEQIYLFFLESEKRVLKKLIKGEEMEGNIEKHSYRYLTRMGVIKNNTITVPLLETYIREYMPKTSLSLTENHIVLNNVNIEDNFSKKEKKLLRLLLQEKNHIVTRDIIAKTVWVDADGSYSDWALDRFIARVRLKLKRLGIAQELIKTVRNKGYILNH